MMLQNYFDRDQALLVLFNWGYIWLRINISQLSIFLLEIFVPDLYPYLTPVAEYWNILRRKYI